MKLFLLKMIRIYSFWVICIIGFCANLQAQTSNEKPNIVWIVTEDNAWHYLKLYNEKGEEIEWNEVAICQ